MNGDSARLGDAPTVSAVLGGTFDPVHAGHIGLATELRRRLAPAQLALMPCYEPPHRAQPQATAPQRVAMLRLALGGNGAADISIDERELRRCGVSWTIDSLREWRGECGVDAPLVFVVGSDAFAAIHTWRDWQELLGCVHLAVVPRPGTVALPLDSVAATLLRERGVKRARALAEQPAGRLWWVEGLPLWGESSTAVRAALAAGRHPTGLAEPVRRYIRWLRLYNGGSERPSAFS